VSAGFWENPITVRVPATSANLGPGFDALGLALGLHDEITVSVTAGGLAVEVEGQGADTVARDETHLVVSSMHRAYEAMQISVPGLLVHCQNRIPHARGLGSSSAAIVGGLFAARASVVDGDERLSNDDLLQLATEIEGHPDNVAPCLFGGFTIAWSGDDHTVTRAVSRRVVDGLSAVAFIPPTGVATEAARGLLPESVPHADAVFNLSRSALLVDALLIDDGRPAALRSSQLLDATDDRLHQQQRSSAMPASADLVARLRQAGLPAAISGAGPTVISFTLDDAQQAAATAIAADLDCAFGVIPLPVDLHGAFVTSG
jgi:homoserine kinase